METLHQVQIYDHADQEKYLYTVKLQFEVGTRLISCRSCTGMPGLIIYEYFHLMTFFKYYDEYQYDTHR
jgi:hypothetical protein